MMKRYFRWLPNALTMSRLVLAVPIAWAAADGRWALGFWLLIVALETDFLDGLAAKKLNAYSKFGVMLDPIADRSLAVGGLIGLVLGNRLPLEVVLSILVIALAVSLYGGRGFTSTVDARSRWQKLTSVGLLFAAWIFVTWSYAVAAYGWSWVFVPITIGVLVGLAMLKRHRLQAWFSQTPVVHKKR